ncbi:hypothetical protein [Streptomyces xanthophaeus]|uniref:hypothetical protein n=1 Tax=Streptomyces xanthophaeus TaxID=67385 RepID=UPI003F4CCBA5
MITARDHDGGAGRQPLLGAAAVLSTPGSAFGANLLANGDFETGTTAGWSCAGGLGSVVSDVYRGPAKGATSTTTSATVTGLAAATAHSFTVRARDLAGNTSPASAALQVTTDAGSDPSGFKQAAPYPYMGSSPPSAGTTPPPARTSASAA